AQLANPETLFDEPGRGVDAWLSVDANGDGVLDLLVSSSVPGSGLDPSTLDLFPGDPAGGYGPPAELLVRTFPIRDILFEDLDGDGVGDFVTA
ncbi:MAG: hypothetical protein AAFP86_21195, partial [Planctomycetota bacterium]